LALWLVTLVVIRLVVQLSDGLQSIWPPLEIVLAIVPILFMYGPVWLCNWRGVDSYDYPLALPAFNDREAWRGPLLLSAGVIAFVTVPWLLGYHWWQTTLFGHELSCGQTSNWFVSCTWPADGMLKLIGYHLFFVAIPEEFFYRGYIQSRLDEIFEPTWKLFGATIGPSLLITSFIFAIGHSVVVVQWWHIFIFVPSLVFGWMRARTDGIVAGALFHAWCNITVSTLDAWYGLTVPPG